MTEQLRRTWRFAPRWIKWCVLAVLLAGLGVGLASALDTDNDGMSDEFESFFGLNPFVDDSALDPDGDTLSNLTEAILFSDPFKADTDFDGFNDNNDSNPVSRASIPWGNPVFTRTNDVVYTWPDWMVAAYKVGGSWDTNLPAWHVDVTDTNPSGLNIEVDRALLTNDLRVRMGLSGSPEATLYLDLYDTNGVVLATNIGDNLLSGIGTGAVRTFSIPLEAHSAAVGLWLRRGTGDVTVSSSLLYVDKDGDGLDASQEQQLGTSDTSLDSDGDGFTDHEEVFIFGTDPASATSLPLGGITGQVSYSGVLSGLIHVQASENGSGSPYAAFTTLSTPGSYQIATVPLRRTYYVKAWRDVDGDGVRDSWEPCGDSVPLSLYLSSSSTNGVNVVMSDPDSDGDGMSDAAERLLGLDPMVSNNYACLPFYEGFETNTVQVGDIAGQNGWNTSISNTFLVQKETVCEGSQALAWSRDSTNEPPSVVHGFASPAVDWTWMDCRVQVAPLLGAQDDFTNDIARFHFNDSGYLVVLDGVINGVPVWAILTNAAPVARFAWARVTVGLDFRNQNWTICLNGIALKTGLAFGRPASELHQFVATGQSGTLDSFHVTTNQPSGLSLDGDRLTDDWELEHFSNLDASETGDPDGDGVNNLSEFQQGLNPVVADTDGDTMPDGWELAHGFNPLASSDGAVDADGDGLATAAECQHGTSPTLADTDGDGLSDGTEVNTWHTNPTLVDSDGDSYRDGIEIQNGTDPLDAQSYPNSHWAQRVLIRLRAGAVSNQLAGVPVLVRLTPERIDYSHCADNGRDLFFTENEGQSLDFEVEKWTPGGESIVWVRLPRVGGTNGMESFLMHWSNPDATNTANAAAVWGTNALGVWHLSETNGTLMDSSAGAHAATNVGALCVTGNLGPARQFRGNDSILVPPVVFASISNQVTISFWQYGATNQPRNGTCFEGTTPVGRELNAHVPWGDGNVYWDAFGNYDRISKLAPTNSYRDAWTHWAFTKDCLAGTMKIYCNGELWHSVTGKTRAYTPVTVFRFGAAVNGSSGYMGLMDEFRVESLVQSPDWIRFQNKLMRDQVLVYGDQEVSISAVANAVEPAQQGAFQIARTSQTTNFPLTVWVEVSGGTAIQGTDYALPRSVTIPAGSTSAYLWVTPLDDLWLEAPETLTVRVADGDYFVNPVSATATLTIQDNDEDTDSDTLCDVWELLNIGNLDTLGTTDSDGDGFNNNSEYLFGTNPLNTDTDNDGLPDGWEVLKGTNPLVNDAAADPDKDGLTNLQEYANGSNPFSADTDADGMPDKWEVDNGFNPANAADAALDADADGLTNLKEYQNQANPRLADTDGDGLEDGAEVNTHHTKPYNADSDADGMPDKWEVENGTNPLVNDATQDPDADGLRNMDERLAGTNPLNADTDGDGLNDSHELRSSHTNPLVAEFNGQITILDTVAAVGATNRTGVWQESGTALIGLNGSGTLDFTLSAPSSGVYAVQIEVGQYVVSGSQVGRYDLSLRMGGLEVGRQPVIVQGNQFTVAPFFLPWTPAGVVTVQLVWNSNPTQPGSMIIRQVRLVAFGGPDANANGTVDWLDTRNTGLVGATSPITHSLVSPVCFEGTSSDANLLTLVADGVPHSIRRAMGDAWYANVPLSPSNDTLITVSGLGLPSVSSNSVEWTSLNLFEYPTNALLIRAGGALKLDAFPSGESNGTVFIEIVGVTNYTTSAGTPVIHAFGTGSFTVRAAFSNDVAFTNIDFHVRSVGASFPYSPACLLGASRSWTCTNVAPEVTLQADPGLVFSSTRPSSNTCAMTFSSFVVDPQYLVFRLAENGPILDTVAVQTLTLLSTDSQNLDIQQTYDDGRQLVSVTVTMSGLASNITMRINTFAGGVTFDDGTLLRYVLAVDFTDEGQYTYYLIRSVDAYANFCHTTTLYQDGQVMAPSW